MPTPPARVAIVGAGPAGLTFAAVLLSQLGASASDNISITIYERDSARESRDQGGSLDMHGPTGQRALRLAGLWDTFLSVARVEGDAMRILDKTGKVWMDDEEHGPREEGQGQGPHGGRPGPPADAAGIDVADFHDPDGRPEIDRGLLKGLLIDALPPGTIHWGRTVTSITPSGRGTHTLAFSSGPHATFDLVIGADGAWSRVRRLLSPAVPFYSGVTMVEVRLSGVDARLPAVAALVGKGSMMAFADNKAIMAQRNSGGRVRAYFALRCAETWAADSGIDWSSVAAARPGLRQVFEGWDQGLLDLLDLCDEPEPEQGSVPGIAARPMYMLPPDSFAWEHTRGLTLVGDAAHLMTPFAGEGANMAMADGAELAEAVADALKGPGAGEADTDTAEMLDRAVRAYEGKMFPRAKAAMEDTFASLNAFMSPDSPQSGIAFFRESIMAQMAQMAEAAGPPGAH